MDYYITASCAMRYYQFATLSGDREVGGYARFAFDDSGDCTISALFALEQDSSMCAFDISAESNAKFLDELTGYRLDPAYHSMLWHTHPEKCAPRMSGTDFRQIEEMASDLPGIIARSMILTQGEILPMMHEAVCIGGSVFHRSNIPIYILDDTGAHADLSGIGWFEKKNSVILAGDAAYPAGIQDYWESWSDSADTAVDDSEQYIGESVIHEGHFRVIVDSYQWESEIVLILDSGTEILLSDDSIIEFQEDSIA